MVCGTINGILRGEANHDISFISVFEILLRISEGKPWKETLLEVLPQRKFQPRGLRRNKKTEDDGMDDDGASDDGNNIEVAESADAEPPAEDKNNEISEE